MVIPANLKSLSPDFNLFAEASIDKMKEKTAGVQVNCKYIHCIRFADDVVISPESEADMSNMLKVLANALEKYKLKIKINK